jgi:hypothetical protein
MYQTFLTVIFQHEYYPVGECPIKLGFTMKSLREANRRKIICAPDRNNRIDLAGEHGIGILNGMHTEILLTVMNDTFYYVTQAFTENPAFRVEPFDGQAGGQVLTVDVDYVLENSLSEITVQALSREKYLEYLCIPKFNAADLALRLAEEKNRVQITEAFEPVTLPDGTLARRFVTGEKIKLHQDNGITMQLWERRDSGERLIAGAIESPDPGQASPFSPKDTITRIFYY